ncbi:MAG: hypothetical protein Q8861_10815 [Bacteroidota bacterium]|nr:hypothetical protein [Bacteroidota bacterium]
MEQLIIDKQTMIKKIYTDRLIWAGTFLGGPLVAGYLIAENFKVLNEPDKVKKTWIFAILATVIIFGGIFLIPDLEKIPRQLIPLIYTAIAYFIVQHYQGEKIKTYIKDGGLSYKWWRALLIGLIGTVITILPIFGIAYLSDTAKEATITTKTYGIVKHEIAFDKDNIQEKDIDKLADGFIKTTFFDQSVTKYVFVKRIDKNYEISISCNKSVTDSPEALNPFIQLHKDIQTMYPDNKIIFNLVVDNLDNIVKKIE